MATTRRRASKRSTREKRSTTTTTRRKRSTAGKRTRLENAAGTFYAKRGKAGRFKELDEPGRSLRADRARKAKTRAKTGYGDKGDRKGYASEPHEQRRRTRWAS